MTNDSDNLRELMDACRRPEEDLQLPEMGPLQEAIASDAEFQQRLDKSLRIDGLIRAAVRDVPIPAGLEARLLAAIERTPALQETAHNDPPDVSSDPLRPVAVSTLRPDVTLAEATASGTNSREAIEDQQSDVPGVAQPATVSPAQVAVRDSKSLRTRRRFVLASMAAAASILLAGLWLARPTGLRLNSQEQAARHAAEWLTRLDERDWSSKNLPLEDYPPPAAYGWKVYRWQKVETSNGSDVVCFNLFSGAPPRSLLFVCRVPGPVELPSSPPVNPISIQRPSGWSVGAWQSSSSQVVYVLAVEAGDQPYRKLVRPNTRIASWSSGVSARLTGT